MSAAHDRKGRAAQPLSPFSLNIRLLLFLFFGIFVFVPLLAMLGTLAGTDVVAVISSRPFARALRETIVSGLLVTAVSLLVSLFMAAALARGGWKKPPLALETVFLLPMLIPSVSIGNGLVLLCGNNGFLTRLFGLSAGIYGRAGIVAGQVLYTAPPAFLLLYNAIREEDEVSHEAAIVLGFSEGRRFFALTLPYLKRDLAAAGFLVFSMSATDYGVPLAVGGKLKTLATLMYTQVAGKLDFGKGTVIGLFLLVPALLSFVFERRRRSTVTARGTQTDPSWDGISLLVVQNRTAGRIIRAVAVLAAVLFALPILSFCLLMLIDDYPLRMQFTLRHFGQVWGDRGRSGLVNSLVLAFGCGILGTVLAVFSAYAGAREKGRSARLLHLFSILTMSVPGLVLGLSYILAFRSTFLYGTMAILILVSVVHFMTTPYLMLYERLGKLDPELEAVGSVLGIPRGRIFLSVILPACRNEILDMFGYFFVNSMATISAVTFLATDATRPLSLLVTQYTDQINPEAAAVLSFWILGINFLLRLVLGIIRRGKRAGTA